MPSDFFFLWLFWWFTSFHTFCVHSFMICRKSPITLEEKWSCCQSIIQKCWVISAGMAKLNTLFHSPSLFTKARCSEFSCQYGSLGDSWFPASSFWAWPLALTYAWSTELIHPTALQILHLPNKQRSVWICEMIFLFGFIKQWSNNQLVYVLWLHCSRNVK